MKYNCPFASGRHPLYSNHGLEAARRSGPGLARAPPGNRPTNEQQDAPCSISVPFCTYGNARKWVKTMIKVTADVLLVWSHLAMPPDHVGWGIFHATDLSSSLSFLLPRVLYGSFTGEGGRERGRGCGYVCKLETPPGERESHYGKHSSQAKEASLGRMAISAHPC